MDETHADPNPTPGADAATPEQAVPPEAKPAAEAATPAPSPALAPTVQTQGGDDPSASSRDAVTDAAKEIESELAAAMAELEQHGGADAKPGVDPSGPSSVPALDQPPAPRRAIRGPRVVQAGREHRTGMVVSVGPTDIFVEFGPKELGVAPRNQWADLALPKVGEQLEVVVERFDSDENIFICSRPGSVQKSPWEMLQPGQVVDARVTGANKGGLELEVGEHRAFMPASQVALHRIDDLSVFVGEKMQCVVSKIDRRGRGSIVLNRRTLLEEERKEKAAKIKGELEAGQTREGVVRKIMPFGAFVDLGGVDGLVHINDLSHERVGHGEGAVAKHVKEGDKVTVRVLKVDWDSNRISLGIKQTQADPFQTAAESVTEGAVITGKVTRLADFGAFVEVAPGVEGLVHVSEIDYRRVRSPADELSEGQVVTVKVLKVDAGSRKISLSIKATKEDPAVAQAAEIQKETPAMRRLREKFGGGTLKGGLG